ncbi:hypothetical protein L195_g058616, partial [Trifolium pratense]
TTLIRALFLFRSCSQLRPTMMKMTSKLFAPFSNDFLLMMEVGGREAWDEGNQASISDNSDADELCPDSLLPDNDSKLLIQPCGFDERCENYAKENIKLSSVSSSFY